jgi:mannose-6-phosphate isomerase-like protein (cupin superfamily)
MMMTGRIPQKVDCLDLQKETIENKSTRKVIYTGKFQVVLMSLEPGQDIKRETHTIDQFFRVEQGMAEFYITGIPYISVAKSDQFYIVPAGTEHLVKAVGIMPLKLYTIYSTPQHPDKLDLKNYQEYLKYEEDGEKKKTPKEVKPDTPGGPKAGEQEKPKQEVKPEVNYNTPDDIINFNTLLQKYAKRPELAEQQKQTTTKEIKTDELLEFIDKISKQKPVIFFTDEGLVLEVPHTRQKYFYSLNGISTQEKSNIKSCIESKNMAPIQKYTESLIEQAPMLKSAILYMSKK